MTTDGISTDDWDVVHGLAVDIFNTQTTVETSVEPTGDSPLRPDIANCVL
jgi:hypothetical protein